MSCLSGVTESWAQCPVCLVRWKTEPLVLFLVRQKTWHSVLSFWWDRKLGPVSGLSSETENWTQCPVFLVRQKSWPSVLTFWWDGKLGPVSCLSGVIENWAQCPVFLVRRKTGLSALTFRLKKKLGCVLAFWWDGCSSGVCVCVCVCVTYICSVAHSVNVAVFCALCKWDITWQNNVCYTTV